jgi:hypothetical protein
MIRREITWRRIEDFIIKKCWSVSTLVPCLNLLPIELQWPIFLQNRVTPNTEFQISFYTFFLFRASLAHARPDVAQPSRTLCFCSRTRFFQKVFLLSNSNLRARESSVRLRDFSRSLITTISLVFPSFLVLAWNTSNLLKPSFFMTCRQLY